MIEFKNVKKVYPDGLVALKNINLTINDGDFVSIIGLSGAGKSTLLRTINKMHDIQEGQILVDVNDDKKELNTNYEAELQAYKENAKRLPELSKKLKEAETNKNDEEAIKLRKEILGVKTAIAPSKYIIKKIPVKMDVSKVKGKELRLLRRNIGMIFQSFNLVKRSSVYKNVLSGRIGYHNWIETICGIYTKREKMLALQSIDSLGILNKSYVRADNLSGGQQQRVALARALTQEPSLILADEPVASLDPITTISVMNDFKKINKEKGITIVANMHHVDLALKYSNRIIGIKAGEIVFDGTPDQVNDEVLQKIYGRALERGENLGGVDND